MPRFVALFTLVLLLLAASAFWPMYLSKSWASIDLYTHAHAVLGTLWLLILVLQPILIVRGYRQAHRMAGRTSLFVALGFFLSGLLLIHFRVSRMTDAAFAKEGIYIYLPLAVAVLFAAACIFGFRWRKSAQVHARFMLSTALLLIDPVLARIMFFYLPPLPSEHLYQAITFTLVMAVMMYLVKSLPQHAPGRTWYRNYCLGTAATLALFFAVPYTSAWLAFANWFRVLPLT
jgi:hypothetical protein